MILVLLGTQNNNFNRLLEEIEKLINKNIIKDEVIVQAGYTKYETDKMKIFDLISREQLEQFQDEANIIITHGGVGSIVSSIKKGKKVIAIPRMHKYEEHVNDHQKEIVELFNKKGYIIGLKDVTELEDAINNIKDFKPVKYQHNNDKMLKIISEFIDGL